jgi:hypothetical protein
VLVASVFFPTRQAAIDDDDRQVLKTVARAYAPWARQHQGLTGKVIGYADPRRSIEPNNQELSERRAFWTATRLAGELAVASHLDPGQFALERIGAGVPQLADDDATAGPAAEANALGPYRRADVYLAGQASDAGPDRAAVPDPVLPPKLHDWGPDGWTRWMPDIERGDKDVIQGVSARMIGYLMTGGAVVRDPRGSIAGTLAIGGLMPSIAAKKPPWWDGRAAAVGLGLGRGARSPRLVLAYKARLMVRDFIETAKWAEVHFHAGDGSYAQMILELQRASPDQAKLEAYATNLAYLKFMIHETQQLAEEVFQLAGG